MKTVKITWSIIVLLAFSGFNEAMGQWTTNGTNIYNNNTGYVGIGNNAPSTLLYVAKNITEPTITVRNLGGIGGATYTMMDNASGANWKFKATSTGGFKIRDHANLLDVFVIEPNSSANALYIKGGGSVGIGTSTPANSALVDMTSATKGFLPPRMTQAQIEAISSPANGLIVFCTTDDKFYAYIASAVAWKEILFGTGTIIQPYSCNSSITINHVAGSVAPVTKTVTYSTVNNIPGESTRCWITQNLGADNQATAVNDTTEASAGWYWQFNRMQGYKHDGTTITPAWAITGINENSDWIAANDPCTLELGVGWRLPTSTEWTNVDASGAWTDWNDPWNSALKMHAAGYLLDWLGQLNDRGSFGFYWSSSQISNLNGRYQFFNSGVCYMPNGSKVYGGSARCLRD